MQLYLNNLTGFYELHHEDPHDIEQILVGRVMFEHELEKTKKWVYRKNKEGKSTGYYVDVKNPYYKESYFTRRDKGKLLPKQLLGKSYRDESGDDIDECGTWVGFLSSGNMKRFR